MVALGAGRAGILAGLVAFAIALAAAPSALAITFLIAGPPAGYEPHAAWLGAILQSLNVLRLGAAAGLVSIVPLLRAER